MEQLHEVVQSPAVALLAAPAAARAMFEGSVARVTPTIALTVKTTDANETRLVATPDTPLADIRRQACADLQVRDPNRYQLVARGEVIGNGGRTLGDLVADGQAELTMRLVRKLEAGAGCPS
jgi:hypothetical protein